VTNRGWGNWTNHYDWLIRNKEQQSDHIYYTLLSLEVDFAMPSANSANTLGQNHITNPLGKRMENSTKLKMTKHRENLLGNFGNSISMFYSNFPNWNRGMIFVFSHCQCLHRGNSSFPWWSHKESQKGLLCILLSQTFPLPIFISKVTYWAAVDLLEVN
jgi:hypothetical protein